MGTSGIGLIALAPPLPAAAHHDGSEYDSSRALALTGQVKASGSSVTVVGCPSRNKPDEMRAERITAGGETIELR